MHLCFVNMKPVLSGGSPLRSPSSGGQAGNLEVGTHGHRGGKRQEAAAHESAAARAGESPARSSRLTLLDHCVMYKSRSKPREIVKKW